MNSFKLFAFAVLGAGALAFGSVSTTACSNSTDDGSAGSAGDAGAAGEAGAGGSGDAGAGGSGDAGAAGAAGGTATSTTAKDLAAALGATDGKCEAELLAMSSADMEMGIDCGKVLANCDAESPTNDTGCAAFIKDIKDTGDMDKNATKDPNCWVESALTQDSGGTNNNPLAVCASKFTTHCNIVDGFTCSEK